LKLRQPRRFTRMSRERFAKNRRQALLAHMGDPSVVQAILIDRAVALEWALRQIDARITADTPIDKLRALIRTAQGTESQLRLTLQALGMKPAAPVDKPLAEILAEIHAQHAPAPAVGEAVDGEAAADDVEDRTNA
jgi:hypothetical protein